MDIRKIIFLLALGSTVRAYSYSSVLDSGDSRAFFAPSSSQPNQLSNSFGVPVYNPSQSRTDLISQSEAQAAMAAYQQAESQEQAARTQMQAFQAAYQQAEAQERQQAVVAQEQVRSQAQIAMYQQAEAQEQARAQAMISAYQQAEAQELARSQALEQEQLRNQVQSAAQFQGVPTITRITVLQPIASTFTTTQDVADSQLAAARQALVNQQQQQWTQPASVASYGYGQQASSISVQPLAATNTNFRFDALSPSSNYGSQPAAAAAAPVAAPTSTAGPLYSSQSTISSALSGLTVSQLLSLLSGAGAGTRAQPVGNSGSFTGSLVSQYGGGSSRQNTGYYL